MTEAQLGAEMLKEAMANKHMRKKEYPTSNKYPARGPGKTGKYILSRLTDEPQTLSQLRGDSNFDAGTARKAIARLEKTEDARCVGEADNHQKLWVRA